MSILLVIIFFPLCVRLGGTLMPHLSRGTLLTLGSLIGLYLISIHTLGSVLGSQRAALIPAALCLALYTFSAMTHWGLLRRWALRGGWRTLATFLLPLLLLLVVQYLPLPVHFQHWLGFRQGGSGPGLFIGVSYMAFRLSYLVMEVRNGTVPLPGILDYLAFAFFLPTLSVGPINTYATHSDERTSCSFPGSLMRILLGAVKFRFLAALVNQLTYAGLLMDGHPHPWVDLPIAAASYYLYLYLNFSGYCDMAIGAAGIIGIRVAENFDNPFAARNVKEFWNRWHITLSTYMRDVVFSPLSKWLVRRLGPSRTDHATAACILVVFLFVGIWHGVGWNYFLFGLAHGLAVVTNHYYSIYLKKGLGRERFRAYNGNPLVKGLATTLTFAYVSASLFLFANDFSAMQKIFAALR